LNKVKKIWSHELKCATNTSKAKVTKVRAEPKTIDTADVNAFTMLPRRYYLSEKLSVLFEQCHAQWTRRAVAISKGL